jgi:hypothetical protein
MLEMNVFTVNFELCQWLSSCNILPLIDLIWCVFNSQFTLRCLNYVKLVKTPGLPAYSSPPPLYKPICGPLAAERGVENNLMSDFVCMSSDGYYGRVLDKAEIEQWH